MKYTKLTLSREKDNHLKFEKIRLILYNDPILNLFTNRYRRWADVGQMLYKYFVFTGTPATCTPW